MCQQSHMHSVNRSHQVMLVCMGIAVPVSRCKVPACWSHHWHMTVSRPAHSKPASNIAHMHMHSTCIQNTTEVYAAIPHAALDLEGAYTANGCSKYKCHLNCTDTPDLACSVRATAPYTNKHPAAQMYIGDQPLWWAK